MQWCGENPKRWNLDFKDTLMRKIFYTREDTRKPKGAGGKRASLPQQVSTTTLVTINLSKLILIFEKLLYPSLGKLP